MNRRERLMTVLLLASGVLLAAPALSPASAQDSTVTEVDLSPNPEQCNQAPRTIEEVEALLASATPMPSTDTQAADEFELPAGEEAPIEVRGGIVETIVQIIACANGGDQLASLGGVTDALLAQVTGGVFWNGSLASLSGRPTALPEEVQTQLLDTREFAVYDDGRVGVLVYFRVPSGQAGVEDPVQIALWIFVQEDGRWLLDEMVTGLEAQLGDMATPPAG